MKANEIEDGKVLMIGDFVIGCIETDIVGEATYKIPCKVTDIHHYGDVICEPLKSFPDELDWQEGDDFSWIEPIPLTAEILEKNGLRKVTLDGEKGSKQDYYIDTHFVGCYNMDALTRVHASPIVYDIKQKWLFVDDKQVCRIALMCHYVHQLQHTLRLCEINKEIVL